MRGAVVPHTSNVRTARDAGPHIKNQCAGDHYIVHTTISLTNPDPDPDPEPNPEPKPEPDPDPDPDPDPSPDPSPDPTEGDPVSFPC